MDSLRLPSEFKNIHSHFYQPYKANNNSEGRVINFVIKHLSVHQMWGNNWSWKESRLNHWHYFFNEANRRKSNLPSSVEIVWGIWTHGSSMFHSVFTILGWPPSTGQKAPTGQSLQRPFQRLEGTDSETTFQESWWVTGESSGWIICFHSWSKFPVASSGGFSSELLGPSVGVWGISALRKEADEVGSGTRYPLLTL